METEVYETIAVNIKIEIFDLDMAEVIWPISEDEDDPGIWMPKETADRLEDDQIGRWFLNKYLIDYGNSYEFTITRGDEKIMKFKRRISKDAKQ
jgi:hypothetical protein